MNTKLVRKVFSFVKYQGGLEEFAKEEYLQEIKELEAAILANQPILEDFLEKNLPLWLKPEGLVSLLTRKFDAKAYREGWRRAHAKGGGRGRKRTAITPEDERITLLYFLAKDLDDKFFAHLTKAEIVDLYSKGGLEGLMANTPDPKKFYRSFYATWKIHINVNQTFLINAPEAFYQNPNHWESPLDKVALARTSGNYLYLWESLTPVGKATLRLLAECAEL